MSINTSYTKTFAEVAVPVPVDKTFTYRVPDKLISHLSVGIRVLVPFKNTKHQGYVIEITSNRQRDDVKDILEVVDKEPLFPESMVPFFKWISEYYLHPIGQVIEKCLPGSLKRARIRTATITEKGLEAFEKDLVNGWEREALAWILANKQKPLPWPYTKLESLVRKGLVKISNSFTKPKATPLMRKFVRVKGENFSEDKLSEIRETLRAKDEDKFLEKILKEKQVASAELSRIFPNSEYLIKKWNKKGVLEIFNSPVYRTPEGMVLPVQKPVLELTSHQKEALDIIKNFIDTNQFFTCLLHGVTGSGKTEVYLRAILHAIHRGKQAILMVPEIALAAYMEAVIRSRFNQSVALYHSGMSAGERFDQWVRMARGEIDLVIGARSAVFAPLPKLGLIVVDEEHDTSYKQDSAPRYQGRDCAVVRGKMEDAVVVLGSGTPSVQSFFNATTGRYHLISMPHRVENRDFPSIELIDMRKEENKLNHAKILSPKLVDAIEETLEQGKQIILFLNRRGFYRFFLCQSCGNTINCPNCEVSLIYHKVHDLMRCHYCGYNSPPPGKCPSCGKDRVKSYGFGTERLCHELKSLFPQARIARMDTDTVAQKGSAGKILKDFAEKNIDILVGTQMITKGYHFPDVTLVGVVVADFSLGFPDFRAGERTYQLLSQVAGRAGRGQQMGNVLIQAFNPEHYAIAAAVSNNYMAFYHKEISLREQLRYPPFMHLISLRLQGNNPGNTMGAAAHLAEKLRNTVRNWGEGDKRVHILGPVEGAIAKLKGKYRWQILIKATSPFLVKDLLNEAKRESNTVFKARGVQLIIDVDPYQMA